MGQTYNFGITVNTAARGYIQLYFNGKLQTLTDFAATAKAGGRTKTTKKLSGNFFPGGKVGAADPQLGVYGHKNPVKNDVYVYSVALSTKWSDVKGLITGILKRDSHDDIADIREDIRREREEIRLEREQIRQEREELQAQRDEI
jgi:hypothetical protein